MPKNSGGTPDFFFFFVDGILQYYWAFLGIATENLSFSTGLFLKFTTPFPL
jgi:hypothetical protein